MVSRHCEVNEIISRSVSVEEVPNNSEPSGLIRSDGKNIPQHFTELIFSLIGYVKNTNFVFLIKQDTLQLSDLKDCPLQNRSISNYRNTVFINI